jgi:hypothetical protein
MGIVLVIIGLIVWLALHFESHRIIGIIVLVLGLLLLFAPWPGAYGYGYWRGRRGP